MAAIECSDFCSVPRNQSIEHVELSSRCLRWFAARATGRGIVGATEIRIADGYVCDAVGIGGFQHRYLVRYLVASGLREKKFVGETVNGDIFNEFACIFEVKVTRADFLSTFGPSHQHANRKSPIGSLHWCVAPKGLIDASELPGFWGLLEASGRGLRQQKAPQITQVSEPTIHKFAYDIMTQGQFRKARWLNIPTCPQCLTDYEDAAAEAARGER